jgi:ceramide glucosyltransferase
MPLALRVLEIAGVVGALCSMAYFLLTLFAANSFLKQKPSASPSAASFPVSILKPLRGTDPGMYSSLRSHFTQDHPAYEIIFGVSEADDPALAIVERLRAEFPECSVKVVHCKERLGANIKVSNLEQMMKHAEYDVLIVNDSDIRVPADYIRRVTAPLADLKVGLVTCLYRGVPGSTAGSQLESLQISTDFCPGVLAARQLEGIRFGLGSTLALRRVDLERIGGFLSLADYLADDYELGNRLSRLGLEISLSEVVVETFLPPYSFAGFILHQLRWARTIRASRGKGYLGLGLTFGLFWALLVLLLSSGATWAWMLLAAVVALRVAMGLLIGRKLLEDRQVPRLLWLLPVRDLIAVAIWIGGLFGRNVAWRGEVFELRKGRLSRIGRPVP